ncbi:MAG: tetraacyldisaccharide 4'-kinase [Bacteroidetes bacterium HGW-Bacteroidetes-19]|nr:MAG: tetraacyldisaccharide 4'-kinase [Bacteroidetes bacterium HGW-Bacteroidetes-20]PKP28354.1 MAG: tetraacyldisaccharide 4'-kinase [Bacteroidetes bacterium HGW-Bacteroidetes-19]
MKIRKLLIPFSILYALIVACRRFLYKIGWFKSRFFSVPTICVGNLRVGGTGKTPQIEFLIEQLSVHYKIAVLSRGYGRSTKGYILANHLSDSDKRADIIGDEPLQYVSKFPNLIVAVCEKRVVGMEKLMEQYPNLDLVLLDDAFQHLAVNYTLKILLTEYNNLYVHDYPFPAGNLREFRKAADNAQMIVVTKSPSNIDELKLLWIKKELKIKPYQSLFFSSIIYKPFIPLTSSAKSMIYDHSTELIVITGIANPKTLLSHLELNYSKITLFDYPDHHPFSSIDLENIQNKYYSIPECKAIIVTTEKDWMRLKGIQENCLFLLPVFTIPIEIRFMLEEDSFISKIEEYVRKN